MTTGESVQAKSTVQWWQDTAVRKRFVSDLIADELARLRRSAGTIKLLPWSDDLRIDRDLGADSLELMLLGTALAETIHLHESGVEDYLLARRTLAEWVEIAGSGLSHFSAALTFRTSGSAGIPKPCTHSMVALEQEVEELAVLFAGRRRILCAVPSHHIYGFLFTVLLPQALGIAADAIVDLRASSPARLAHCLRAGDLVVGHPEFWHAVSRCVPQFAEDVVGVTSTAPCPVAVSEAIEQAGMAQLVQVYGASETAGIGWRASHRDAYRLFPYWSFDAVQPNRLLRTLPDGTCQLADAPDALERQDANRFLVGGRLDAAVQIAGINVFPTRVADLLRQHPGVQEVAVRLMHPDEGNRLKAFVVPAAGVVDTAQLRRELHAWIDVRLPAVERPKAIAFGTALPHNASGKLCDWAVDGGRAGADTDRGNGPTEDSRPAHD